MLNFIKGIAKEHKVNQPIQLENLRPYVREYLGEKNDFFKKFNAFKPVSQGFILEAIAELRTPNTAAAETKIPENAHVNKIKEFAERVIEKFNEFRTNDLRLKSADAFLGVNQFFRSILTSIVNVTIEPHLQKQNQEQVAETKMQVQKDTSQEALTQEALVIFLGNTVNEVYNDNKLVSACRNAYQESSCQSQNDAVTEEHKPENKPARKVPT